MPILTPGELEVIKVLWEHGELSPTQLQEHFPRPIKNAALRFQLRVLVDKKHVARRKEGRAYYYRALTPRQGTFRSMAQRMADVFFGGSAAGLIAELIKTENMSPEEIQDLQKLAKAKVKLKP